MTQPHMVRSRPYRYFSLQIGSLQGLAATRKCTLAQRAAEGAGQGRHSPAQPHATLEALGRRGGPEAGAVTPPALAFLPPPPLPRGARHVGRRELRRASPRSPGWPRLGRAPTTPVQPTCPLLGPEAPTSSWALRRPPVPSQAREVRRGPATGGTCVPRSQIRETVPAAGARGDRSVCWNLSRCVRYEKPNVFTHLKILSFCCLDVAGAVLKALPWVSLRPWGPEGRFARCPFTSPQVSRCSAVGIWTPNDDGALRPRETRPTSGLDSLAMTRDIRALSPEGSQLLAPRASQAYYPDFRRAASKKPCGAEQSPWVQLFFSLLGC